MQRHSCFFLSSQLMHVKYYQDKCLKLFRVIKNRNCWKCWSILAQCVCVCVCVWCVRACVRACPFKWKPYVTLDHKMSLKLHGYICSNRQQNILWVKMINFTFMPKIISLHFSPIVPYYISCFLWQLKTTSDIMENKLQRASCLIHGQEQ